MSVNNADDGAPALITATQVARLLQISTRSLWRLRSGGQLPAPVKVGAAVRWRLEEIKNWITNGCPLPAGRENMQRRI